MYTTNGRTKVFGILNYFQNITNNIISSWKYFFEFAANLINKAGLLLHLLVILKTGARFLFHIALGGRQYGLE